MFFTVSRRVIATLGLAYVVGKATEWWAWHPLETSGLRAAFTTDLSANWATAGWAIIALIVMIWGVMDKRRWTTVLGYAALAVALTTGVFVTRGVTTADVGLTMRMVGVALLGVALFLVAIWPSRPERDQVEVHGWGIAPRSTSGEPGRVVRAAQRLNAWGLGLERRFGDWRENRRLDREWARAQRVDARRNPPPIPSAPADGSTNPAASASGTPTTS